MSEIKGRDDVVVLNRLLMLLNCIRSNDVREIKILHGALCRRQGFELSIRKWKSSNEKERLPPSSAQKSTASPLKIKLLIRRCADLDGFCGALGQAIGSSTSTKLVLDLDDDQNYWSDEESDDDGDESDGSDAGRDEGLIPFMESVAMLGRTLIDLDLNFCWMGSCRTRNRIQQILALFGTRKIEKVKLKIMSLIGETVAMDDLFLNYDNLKDLIVEGCISSKSLARLVERSPTLELIDLSYMTIENWDGGPVTLLEAIAMHPKIKKCAFQHVQANKPVWEAYFRCLSLNTTLRRLKIRGFRYECCYATETAWKMEGLVYHYLEKNPPLEDLVWDKEMDINASIILSHALRLNKKLKAVTLGVDGEVSETHILVDALGSNDSIEHFRVSVGLVGRFCFSDHWQGVELAARCLQTNVALRSFHVYLHGEKLQNYADGKHTKEICDLTSISEQSIDSTVQKLQLYLKCNAAGRKLMGNAKTSDSLCPYILAKVSSDINVIHELLKTRPSIFSPW
mmetsp:Transcript_49250/g.73442  ORF Transcript_49250/g.73442 Transcript_49250/m.73442 type:complete len:512 (-) Transcript_49250:181-1716(-)